MAGTRKQQIPPTFIYKISINGAPEVDSRDIEPERLAEIRTKLTDRMCATLGFFPVEDAGK